MICTWLKVSFVLNVNMNESHSGFISTSVDGISYRVGDVDAFEDCDLGVDTDV